MEIVFSIRIFLLMLSIFTGILFLHDRVDVVPIMKIYKGYPLEVFLEKWRKYREEGKNDSALILFDLVEQRFSFVDKGQTQNKKEMRNIITALQASAQIYFPFCNYDKALEFFFKTLSITGKSSCLK